MPECGQAATAGEDWKDPDDLAAVEQFRLGMELRLTVRDLAVVLLLCEVHARELLNAAWTGTTAVFDGWGWKPLPPRT